MNIKNKINLIEVGPRDGFQNLPDFIPTEVKIHTIEKIIASGVRDIEITSFVSPKAIPQMVDATDVAKTITEKYADDSSVRIIALIPNLRGAEAAVACGIGTVSIVISVSELHNKANVGRTPSESLKGLKDIIETYPNLVVRLEAATAFGCPFGGEIPESDVLRLVNEALDIGVREIILCDTIGIANPAQVDSLTCAVQKEIDGKYPLGLHLHDTRGLGVVNAYAGFLNGIDTVESSIGGLGGCPFAPGAAGNTATEDILNMLEGMGIETGVDLPKYMEALAYVQENIKNDLTSRMAKVGVRKR